MNKPQRIQLSRKKGWRMPPNTVKVDRSTRYGNPCHCDKPYGCPYSKEFERGAWEGKDGQVSPLRCCVDVFRHYVETGIKNEPTTTGRFVFAIEATAGYPNRKKLIDGLENLRGKNLACWCKPEDKCHADVLLEIANR